MGRDHKALIDWGGVPLVQHQCLRLLEANFDPVVVVTGSRGEEVAGALPEDATGRLRRVHNDDWEAGRSGSIEAGAHALPDAVDGVLVVAVDQPLRPEVLNALVGVPPGPPLVLPRGSDGRTGHPILLGRDTWRWLRDCSKLDQGLRDVVTPLRDRATLVDVDVPVRWDINTPADYLRAVEQT